jgi:transposase InsO family protein
MVLPQGPNQRWSLDFVSDALGCGRRFRILCVVDDFTRECLALVADTSLSGGRVAREHVKHVTEDGRLRIEVRGELGAILRLAEGARNGKRPGVVAEAFVEQIKGDAGTRIGLCRTVLRSAQIGK